MKVRFVLIWELDFGLVLNYHQNPSVRPEISLFSEAQPLICLRRFLCGRHWTSRNAAFYDCLKLRKIGP